MVTKTGLEPKTSLFLQSLNTYLLSVYYGSGVPLGYENPVEKTKQCVNLGGLRKKEAWLMMIDPSPVLVGT